MSKMTNETYQSLANTFDSLWSEVHQDDQKRIDFRSQWEKALVEVNHTEDDWLDKITEILDERDRNTFWKESFNIDRERAEQLQQSKGSQ